DIADEPGLSFAEKRERLERLREAIAGEPGEEAMLVALADARQRYPIPARALNDLIDGGLQDLDQQRYGDFDELLGYCRRVAGAVGVACVAVYGADQPQKAETLGIALQLINIMRDVAEDWELGRVYLPQDELASFGIVEADIAAGRTTPAWQALMSYQGARARVYLADGVTLLEARPTLGGAVQTLPERDGDPAPPPDNGQHVALGCCAEYVRFVESIGAGSSLRRLRLALPVIDERGRVARIGNGPLALLR